MGHAGRFLRQGLSVEGPLLHALLIAVIGLLVYSNTFSVPFQWDEHTFIADNPIVKDLSYFLEPSKAQGLEHYEGLRNRYVGYLSFALNYRLHGLDVTGYHVFNLALHVVNSLLVYLLVVFVFGTPFFKGSDIVRRARQIGLFSSLLFVVHPVQTEAVTYIFQRLASLAAFFYLSSMVLYIKWRQAAEDRQEGVKGLWPLRGLGRSPKGSRASFSFVLYALSLLCAVLAMKTKENAFTLPITITLSEFVLFAGPLRDRILRLAPFIVTLVIIPFTLLAGADAPLGDTVRGITGGAMYHSMTPKEYFFTELRVIATYMRLLLVPVGQTLDYDYSVYKSFFDVPVLLSLALFLTMIGIAGYVFYRLRFENPGFRLVVLGLLLFFVTLSVESSLIVLPTLIDEYRLYLPSAGFFISAVTGAFMLFEGLKSKAVRGIILASMLVVMAVFAYAAYARNNVWKTNAGLWADVVDKAPNNARGRLNLGLAYASSGRTDMAIEQFQLALTLRPDYAEAHNNLGLALSRKGLHSEAIRHFRRAIILRPDFAEAYNNLGLEYEANGLQYKAIEQYRLALGIKPDFAEARNNLGLSLASEGHFADAIEQYQNAIKLSPEDIRFRYNLALAYLSSGEKGKAREEFNRVVEEDPSHPARQFLRQISR